MSRRLYKNSEKDWIPFLHSDTQSASSSKALRLRRCVSLINLSLSAIVRIAIYVCLQSCYLGWSSKRLMTSRISKVTSISTLKLVNTLPPLLCSGSAVRKKRTRGDVLVASCSQDLKEQLGYVRVQSPSSFASEYSLWELTCCKYAYFRLVMTNF